MDFYIQVIHVWSVWGPYDRVTVLLIMLESVLLYHFETRFLGPSSCVLCSAAFTVVLRNRIIICQWLSKKNCFEYLKKQQHNIESCRYNHLNKGLSVLLINVNPVIIIIAYLQYHVYTYGYPFGSRMIDIRFIFALYKRYNSL